MRVSNQKHGGLIYHAIESIQRCTWHFVDWRANINKVNQQEYSYAYFEEYENRKLWTCSKLSNREGGYLHHNEMLLYPGTWPGSGQTCGQLKLRPILLTWINFNPNIPNVNGWTVEVWEWMNNFTHSVTRHMITYTCSDIKLNHVRKCNLSYQFMWSIL